ncbi:MAG: hypothetical protein IKB73_05440 [Ruminococcus sp.]|nr:hypothetical protein [Ruminococcus sp.]
MINKAFTVVCNRVTAVLESQGFAKNKVNKTDENELVALYTGENVAYTVVYYKDKMHMVMRSCTMTDDGPDNEWKTIATWMFDPATDTEKEAASIGNDFAEALNSTTNVKRVKKTIKKKSKESAADAMALYRRIAVLTPDLRYDMKEEEENYEKFRVVTFAREHVVSRVDEIIRRGVKKDITKFVSIIEELYKDGDPDVRSIITIVLLSNIDDKNRETLSSYLSPELLTASKCALKYKGKKVKPEKAPKRMMMDTGNRL